MQTVNVILDTMDKVKGFVGIAGQMEGDLDLGSGRYIVDAKSIMGIFSLDLSKPLKLTIHNDSTAEKLVPMLQEYIV